MKNSLSNLFLCLILISSTNKLLATTSTASHSNKITFDVEVLNKKTRVKKIKLELYNGKKIKAFVIRVDDQYVYSVPKRKMVRTALDFNCQNCDKTLLSSIKKVQKTSNFLLILASVLLVLGFGLITILAAGSRDSDQSTIVSTIYLIIAAIPISFFIGWAIGALLKKKFKDEEAKQFLYEHSAEYLNK